MCYKIMTNTQLSVTFSPEIKPKSKVSLQGLG